MPPVRIANRRIWIGDQSIPFLGGEIHYWRIPPASWRAVLGRARELGLPLVSTYICWEFHEIAPGEYDFTGATDPRRNLVGFLDLVADMGLWLAIRPGPYFYGEWRNAGVPDRAARVPRTSPEFRALAEEYLRAVVPVIAPYFATRGGPIVLLQADNEPDPWHHIWEAQLGFGETPGQFQEFLRARYDGDLTALNAAWETDLADFALARAVTTATLRTRAYLNRTLDFVRFRHWGTRDIVRWTVETYRALGVDIPIYVNTYTIFDIQNWRELEELCDLAAPDAYPTQAFGAPDEHWKFLDINRYPRSYSSLPCIPELQAGIWDGGQYAVGVLTPNHYRLVALSALLVGIVGWDWYMLASRENWLMSPVNELGAVRPDLWEVFADLVRVYRELDPPSLEKQVHAAVTVDPVERTARLGSGERLRRALYEADLDYDPFDVATGRLARPLLFYGGGDWLSAEGQQRLVEYVEQGGTLVFLQETPTLDERLNPLNLLGLPQPVSVLQASYPQRLSLTLGGETVTLSSGSFFIYDDVPGEPLVAERIPDATGSGAEMAIQVGMPVGQRYVVGYRQALGAGSVILLGLEPTPPLLVVLHRWLGVPIPSHADLPGVVSALFRRGDALYLIAANNGDEARDATVALDPALLAGGAWSARDLFTDAPCAVIAGDAPSVVVRLPRKSGTAVELRRVAG